MKRRLFNLAAAVSLVLCVGSIALWVRSYQVSDLLLWRHGRPANEGWVEAGTGVRSLQGHLIVWRDEQLMPVIDPRFAQEMAKQNGFYWLRQKPESFAKRSYHDALVNAPLSWFTIASAWPIVRSSSS